MRVIFCYGCFKPTLIPHIYSTDSLYCKYDKTKTCQSCLFKFQKTKALKFYEKYKIMKEEKDDEKEKNTKHLTIETIPESIRYNWECLNCEFMDEETRELVKLFIYLHLNRN